MTKDMELKIDAKGAEFIQSLKELSNFGLYEARIDFSSDGRYSVHLIDRANWNTKELEKNRIGDKLFLNATKKGLKSIASDLLAHTRELDPWGKLVQGENPRRYTNYRFTHDKIFTSELYNFVSSIPQEHSIHVNVRPGDYSFITGAVIHPDARFPYFKVSDTFELQTAKDVIEVSYFYSLGWDMED